MRPSIRKPAPEKNEGRDDFRVILCGNAADAVQIYEGFKAGSAHHIKYAADLRSGLSMCEGPLAWVLILDHDAVRAMDPADVRVDIALRPAARVLALVEDADADDLEEWLRAGMAGFLPRSSSFETVRTAIATVAAGEIWASRRLISKAMRSLVGSLNDRFTVREIEILQLIAAGEDNRRIADQLCVTRETVRWHLRSAYAKLRVHDRQSASELVSAAFR